jgi:hypothetical protein
VTGQVRMLLFRHGGKTSSIPPPSGGPTAAIVVVARWRKEYHVVVSHPDFRGPKPGREHNHQVCWDQVSHI